MGDSTSSVTSDLDNNIVVGKSNILREDTYWIYTICVKDNLIISCSNGIIHICDITKPKSKHSENREYVQVLTGHTSYVLTICVKDNLIISGSEGTIRIWDRYDTSNNTSTNKYDYTCMQVLTEHTNWISTICVKDNLIISGSYDKTIRVWNITNTSTNKYDYKCVQVLTGHTNCVNTICVKNNLIISGSSDKTIRIWDMTNTNSDTSTNKYDYKCVQVLTGHTNSISTICVKDNLIISGSCDNTIRVTPINLFPNESHIFNILINNYHLVSYLQTEILDYFKSG